MPERDSSADRISFATFTVDVRSGELWKAGRRVRLQEQPFRVLVRLLERPQEVVTREELRRELWAADTFVDFERALNSAVKRLRERLGDSAEHPRFIETMPRRGYRFIAPISQTAAVLVPPARTQLARWKRSVVAVLGAGVLIAAILALLTRTPHLTERDDILLAEFVNRTGDRVFDGVLRQALAIKLDESPFLNVVSDGRLSETLRLMRQPADARLTPDLARQVCERQAIKATIAGEILAVGSRYAVSVDAADCRTGEVLARVQEEASSKETVLAAVGHAGSRLRSRLGEVLRRLELDKPLAEATTSSLEALRAFSLAEARRSRGAELEAIPFYRTAIERDPEFGLAYSRVAAVLANVGEREAAARYATEAFRRAHSLTERERLYIMSKYSGLVSRDFDMYEANLELWKEQYPRDWRPHNLLAGYYTFGTGQCDRALNEALEGLRLEASYFAYSTAVDAYECLGQFAEAKTLAERAVERQLDGLAIHLSLYRIAFALGDSETMQRQIAWGARRRDEHIMRRQQAEAAVFAGQLRRARVLSQEATRLALDHKFADGAAHSAARAALWEALAGNPRRARTQADAALRLGPDSRTFSAWRYWTIAAMGLAGSARAEPILRAMDPTHDEDRATLRAAIELGRGRPARAIEALRASTRYDLGAGQSLLPVYLRGLAFLALGSGRDAAAEFRKIIDRRGIAQSLYVAAHVGLARAYARTGDIEKARELYERFFALWQKADPDVPLLQDARREYARLREGNRRAH